MRAHVRFTLYRDVLQILAQLDEPCPGARDDACACGAVDELPEVLATLATLTPPGCPQRLELLECLKAVLERHGADSRSFEALEVAQAA
jgi:hypothetical protein